MQRLAIVTTHPIQYYAPIFQLLHQRGVISIKVFYTWGEKSVNKFDPGFNKTINWDIPLTEGYPFEWVTNTSADPGSHHFKGIINPGLNKQIKQFSPDAILFFGWAYNSHLKAMRYFKNKLPVYFRGDSTLLDERKSMKSVLRSILLKWVYRHVDIAFYTGTNNKAYFKKFGLKDSQLSFAPHAIDNARFSLDRHDEAKTLRDGIGLSADDLLIVFAGKFEEKKDPGLLLAAFQQQKKSACHLLFVGNGPLEDELKQMAQNNANIHFMDACNQSYMPVVYQASDLFCLPSKGPGETWGLAINEAMACGKAILASDKVGCAVDLVKENYNGATFASCDSDDLSKKLDALTRSPEKLKMYGSNSLKLIEDWNCVNIAIAIESTLLNEKKRQD